MPAAGYTVGRDLSFVFVDPDNGGVQSFPVVSALDFKQLTKQLQWTALDGTNSYADLPQGWEIEFDVERASPQVWDLIIQAEANYYLGISMSNAYLMVTIANPDGSASQYRFIRGTYKLMNGGSFKGDDKVTMKLAARFSRCLRIV